MNEFTMDWLFQLLRISIVLSVAVFAASGLLRITNAKPATRLIAWLMVLLPGWLLFSITLEIPWYQPQVAEVVTTEATAIPIVELLNATAPEFAASAANDGVEIAATINPITFVVSILFTVWLLGMLALIARYVRGYFQLTNAARKLQETDNAQWQQELESVCQASSFSEFPLLKTSSTLGPLVCRVDGKNQLVVPESFWNQCSPEQRIAILQHELCHIQRRDLRTAILARIFVLPQWFNPVAWFALRRLNEAIEMACDDHALSKSTSDPIVYASSLLALVEFRQSATTRFSPALLAAGPPIKQRIQRIVQSKGIEMKFTKMLTLFSLAILSLAALLRLELVAQESNEPASPPLVETPIERPALRPVLPAGIEVQDEQELIARAYFVGDLVLPINAEEAAKRKIPLTIPEDHGLTKKDFQPLMDLITNTISPLGWEHDGDNSITVFLPNLSLIVSCPADIHDQLQDLLGKLRELSAVTIKLKAHFVFVDHKHALPRDLLVQNACSEEEFVAGLEKWSENSVASIEMQDIYLFNGETIEFGPADTTEYQCERLEFNSTLTSDLEGISLRIFQQSVANTAPNLASLEIGNIVNRSEIGTTIVPSKGQLIVDVSSILKNNDDNRRAILIARPTIIDRRSETIAKAREE